MNKTVTKTKLHHIHPLEAAYKKFHCIIFLCKENDFCEVKQSKLALTMSGTQKRHFVSLEEIYMYGHPKISHIETPFEKLNENIEDVNDFLASLCDDGSVYTN